MSIKAIGVVFSLPDNADITSVQRLVLLALADYSDDDGKCWPGIKKAAQKCGLKRQSFHVHLKALAAKGWIVITPRYRDDGSRSSNDYHLPFIGNMQEAVLVSIPPPVRKPIQGSTETDTGAVRKPIHLKEEPSVDPSVNCQETKCVGFVRFWQTWPGHPRKAGKVKCLGIWKRDKLEEQADSVIAAVKAYIHSEGWMKDDHQYIPAPAAWLRQGKYDCDLADIDTGYDDSGETETERYQASLPE